MRRNALQEAVLGDAKGPLAKVEGQVRGLRRMLAEGRQCNDILIQMSAVLGALKQARALLVACSVQEQIAAFPASGASPEYIARKIAYAFTKII